MTSFELKLLKFFQNGCVPLFLFNVDKAASKRYSVDLAPYVAALPCVRNSVFALACLMLWPRKDVQHTLSIDNPQTFLSGQEFPRDFGHIYVPLGEGESPQANLLVHTLSYFDKSIVTAQDHISMLYSKMLYDGLDVKILEYNTDITFVYLGLLPNHVMSLFDPKAEFPLDLLEYAMNYIELTTRVTGKDVNADTDRDVQRFITFDRKRWTSSIVNNLRAQLSAAYFGSTTFIEINSQICYEFGILEDHLSRLEYLIFLAQNLGAPQPIFMFPFMLTRDFVMLVRSQNQFALRIMLVFACLGVYCGFYIIKKKNIWAEYIDWFCMRLEPMCDFDARLIHYVHFREYRTDFLHFRSWLDKFHRIWDELNFSEDAPFVDETGRMFEFPVM